MNKVVETGHTRRKSPPLHNMPIPHQRAVLRATSYLRSGTTDKGSSDYGTSGEPSLVKIAEVLGLPASSFGAAFRATTSTSHSDGYVIIAWKRQTSVEGNEAHTCWARCGFADQPHFRRVVNSHTGKTPVAGGARAEKIATAPVEDPARRSIVIRAPREKGLSCHSGKGGSRRIRNNGASMSALKNTEIEPQETTRAELNIV